MDIFSNKVHRYALADGSKTTWTFDFEVTSLSPRKTAVSSAPSMMDTPGSTSMSFLHSQSSCRSRPAQQPLNDGKVDNSGRYWAGTMDIGQGAASGSLYRLDPDLSVQQCDTDYIICNGPTFNLANSIIYHTDSIKRTIYALDMAPTGELSNKRVFTEFTQDDEGVPDGMTVDSEDCIWVAHFGGARITRYSPAGEILQVVPIPALNVTSCTFAGSDLDTLYIVTASTAMSDEQLKQYPLAGSLFSYKPGCKGRRRRSSRLSRRVHPFTNPT